MDQIKQVPGAQWLEETGIVAIVRGVPKDTALPLAEALFAGGIRCLEVTLNTPDAPHIISDLNEHFGGKMWIGAGTVVDRAGAEEAHAAGAKFFVTPNTDDSVIQYGIAHAVPVMSGAFTPTEIVHAHQAGASIVKIFPCSSVGAMYLKELQGPLSHIPMMAVGGVSVDNAADYIRAGACSIGVGGSLVDKEAILAGDFGKLRRAAEALVEAVSIARSGTSSV